MLALALFGAAPLESGVTLRWEAPAGCPDEAEARAEIAARLADRPVERKLRAQARVRALADDGWQVEVEIHGEEGTAVRTLRAATCEEALTATAVVLAIAVGPEEAVVPSPPEEAVEGEGEGEVETEVETEDGDAAEVEVEPELTTVEPPPAVREPTPAPPPSRGASSLAIAIDARGGLDLGALPSPAAHVAAGLGLLGRRFTIQASALHRIRTEMLAALPIPAGGRFRLTAGQLLAGPRLRWGRLELPLAAGVEAGAIWARGTGAVEPIAVRRAWAAAVARVGVGFAPWEALALQLGVDGVVPLLRPVFTLGDEVEVHAVGPVAVRAWLGVTVRFSLNDGGLGGKEPVNP